jgi:excinuclease UvrABC helicase subunit UvrB
MHSESKSSVHAHPRKGEYDVLIGINLLRESLNLTNHRARLNLKAQVQEANVCCQAN